MIPVAMIPVASHFEIRHLFTASVRASYLLSFLLILRHSCGARAMTSNGGTTKVTVVFVGDGFLGEHLDLLNWSGDCLFNFKQSTASTVEECVRYLRETGQNFVIPARDAYSVTASIANQQFGFPTPSLLSIIACNNKNLTRTLIGKFGWFHGFNLDQPIECVCENVEKYPCMLKPTMLAGGNISFCCENEPALCSNLEMIQRDVVMRQENSSFCSEAVAILKGSNTPELVEKCTEYMIEEYIDIAIDGTYQYCMEGFISCDGRVIAYSLVEELCFKNGMILGHVIPPVHCDGNFAPFEDFMEWVGKKMWDLGFRNQAFDIEFWQLPNGGFRVIEVNPRMAASYYDLYHLYSGNNFYEDVASFVCHGIEPEKSPLPHLKHMWHTTKRNHTHSFQIGLTTRATGKVSDVFDIDFLQDRITNGLAGFIRYSKDSILDDVHSTSHGAILSNVTLQGSWNEIVLEAKSLRENLYKDREQFYEADEYPDYFIAE